MKLSLDAICEQLSASGIVTGAALTGETSVRYSFPELYQGGDFFQPNQLYVADGAELPHGIWMRSSVGLIVRGQVPDTYLMQNCPVLSVSSDVSIATLYAAVSALFWKHQKWTGTLNHLLAIHAPLEKYLEITRPLVDTSIYVCDKVGKVLAFAEYPVEGQPDSLSLSAEFVSPLTALFPSKDFQAKSALSQKAFEATGKACGTEWPCYYRRLSNKAGDFLGYLVLGSQCAHIRETDKLIANHLGNILEFSLDRMVDVEGRRRWEGSYLFKDMLDGTPLAYSEFNYLLKEQGLLNCRFCCIRLILKKSSLRLPVEHICWHINAGIKDVFAMAYDSGIVLFLRLPMETYHIQQLPEEILALIREGGFCAGVSHVFTSVRDTKHYYFQTCKALELGARQNPEDDIYFFSKYALQYILNQTTPVLPARVLCMEGVKMLQDLDQTHDSEYCRTLRVYFENGMYLQKTANDLFIHRSTLTYRLNRIQTEAGIDLGDYHSRLYAMLSLEMLEN